MDKEKYLTLSQLGVYNPQRLDDKTVESLFVVRKKFFDLIINKIKKESPKSIPQHYLIIGQRGMGKSTMLKRIEVELRKEDSQFIPLLFPEEQYNLNKLSEFWLNSLDAMADALEVQNKLKEVKIVDAKIVKLEKIEDEDDLAKKAFQFLIEMAKKISKRPVLLIDNMSFVFDRLNKNEQHTLRSWLMQNEAPILVGASAVEIEETYNYEAPFYDAFQISYLKKLSFEELIEVLSNLAKLTNAQEVLSNIHEEIARLKTIHQLTGGNPRTAVMLFKIIVKGFSKEINDDLEALLDEITPLYKARFEELPTQLQIIVDAVALNWDPINLEQLRKETRLANNQLSPQLKRLAELGWIEKLAAYKAKGNAYQISERFFNIWFLMRRSSRRQKKELYCLSKFLETFYGDDINDVAKNSLTVKSKNLNQITYKLALADAVGDENLKKQLRDSCSLDIKEHANVNPNATKELESYLNQKSDKNLEVFISNRETNLLKSASIDDNNYENWFNLGYFYQVVKNDKEKSKEAYLKAIELNVHDSNSWNNIGNIYNEVGSFFKAEEAYKRAIKINPNINLYYQNLGMLYLDLKADYTNAEKAFLKAIKINSKSYKAWCLLGELYMYNLTEFKKAEETFLKATELDADSRVYNLLGNLYQDYLKQYDKAEVAYLKSIEIDSDNDYTDCAKYNLVFLYRDKLNNQVKAEDLFNTVKAGNNFEDSYWLNKSLFELYKKNQGNATEHLMKALDAIKDVLPTNTQDDWWRFAGVVIKLGFGDWLLSILKENDLDIKLAPYYVAIKAIVEKDINGYLNSRAVEIREPARKIVEIIKNIND